MKIAGILFDKDGTLLDYHRTWMPVNREAALRAAGGDKALSERLLALAGYDTAAGRVRADSPLAAWSTAEIAELWASELPAASGAELTPMMEAIFVGGSEANAVPVTDLAALFGRFKARGLVLGVATHDSHAGAKGSLAPFGVLEQLDFVAGYDSGHGTKPGPGMVQGFCAATGLRPGDVAVVGDNLHDLHMGRSAGAALVIGVLTGTSAADDLTADADHVLDDIDALEALLEGLGRL